MQLNIGNKKATALLLRSQCFWQNIFIALCIFALEKICFVIFPPLLVSSITDVIMENLWQMELFWIGFPGCVFPDETH